jgi:hypothetical protein
VPVGRRKSQVIKTSFPHLTSGEAGKKRIEAIIPTYGTDYRLSANAAHFSELQQQARKALQLV